MRASACASAEREREGHLVAVKSALKAVHTSGWSLWRALHQYRLIGWMPSGCSVGARVEHDRVFLDDEILRVPHSVRPLSTFFCALMLLQSVLTQFLH
jgi:hypothetical protein